MPKKWWKCLGKIIFWKSTATLALQLSNEAINIPEDRKPRAQAKEKTTKCSDYICFFCGIDFTRLAGLIFHLYVHLDVYNYQCDQMKNGIRCLKLERHRDHFKKHLLKEHQIKNFDQGPPQHKPIEVLKVVVDMTNSQGEKIEKVVESQVFCLWKWSS